MERPFGWFTDEDAAPYVAACEQLKPGGVVVEIGTYQGRSASYVVPVIKERGAKFFVIDPFIGVGGQFTDTQTERDNLRAMFEKNMQARDLMDAVTILQSTSVQGCNAFDTNSIDIVYVDGMHDFGNVLTDIYVWFPRIKPGGWIMGHDYGNQNHKDCEGVERAVKRRFQNPQIVSGWTWGYRKLPSEIHIETCAHCNRSCSFCPTNNTVFPPKEFMSEENFRKIVADIASFDYAGTIGLQGHNEPLLDKRLPEFIRILRESVPKCAITISTNGDAITSQTKINELFDAGLSSLLVNLYDDKYAERMKSVGKALQADDRYSVHTFGPNTGFYPMRYDAGYRTVSIYTVAERPRGASTRAGNILPELTVLQPPKLNCMRPTNSMHIKWNGNAILCCQDWREEVVIGNAFNTHVLDIYGSPMLSYYQRKLCDHDREGLTLCNKCEWGF